MNRADVIIIAVYFTSMILVGLRYSRQMKSADVYFAGGRQVNWWMGGVSLLMSYVSALSIIVYAGLGYQYGLVSLTLYWVNLPAAVITTLLFARRWRRADVITPTEFLERRFSRTVQQLIALSGIPLKIIDEGLKIVAVGVFVSVGLHIPAWISIVCVGVTIVVYAALGGLWAVVVTDFIQFVLVAGVVVLLLPLTLRAAGGWTQVRARLPGDMFSIVHEPFGWLYVAAFLVLNTISLSGNWSLIQKFYSARTDRDAVRVGWLACALFCVLPPFWILTGLVARCLIREVDPQTIYARISVALLPPGMVGLVVAALFAATMSVLSCGYNVISSVVTMDVYRGLVQRNAEEKDLVRVGRILTVAIGAIALGTGLCVNYFHWTIFDTMVATFGLFVPPTVIPMLAGLVNTRLSSRGAIAGFSVGIGVGLGFLLARMQLHPPRYALFDSLSLLIPACATIVTLVLATILMPATRTEAVEISRFFSGLQRSALPPTVEISNPTPIAGLIIGLMGLSLLLVGAGVIPRCPRSTTPIGVGTVFLVIGVTMFWAQELTPPSKRNVGDNAKDRVN